MCTFSFKPRVEVFKPRFKNFPWVCARTLDAGLGDLIISRLKSYLVENVWATTFHANHSLDGPMNACGSENSKCNIFPSQKLSLFLP